MALLGMCVGVRGPPSSMDVTSGCCDISEPEQRQAEGQAALVMLPVEVQHALLSSFLDSTGVPGVVFGSLPRFDGLQVVLVTFIHGQKEHLIMSILSCVT